MWCIYVCCVVLGLTEEELVEELRKRKKAEVDPHTGKMFAYVYTSEDQRFYTIQKIFDMFEFEEDGEEVNVNGETWEEAKKKRDKDVAVASDVSKMEMSPQAIEDKSALVQMFFHAFMHENALNPMVFPGLKCFETEIVSMVGHMLHAGIGAVGGVTSGGTESILMAVKTYRDRARHLFPSIKEPEMVSGRLCTLLSGYKCSSSATSHSYN